MVQTPTRKTARSVSGQVQQLKQALFPDAEFREGKNGGKLLARGTTRVERVVKALEAEGFAVVPPDAPEPEKKPTPPKIEGYSELADLIQETQPVRECGNGLLDTVCPLCRAPGHPMVITGEEFACMSDSCQGRDLTTGEYPEGRKSRIYISNPDGTGRKTHNRAPIRGNKRDWLNLMKAYPRLFKNPPDSNTALAEVAQAEAMPWGPRDEDVLYSLGLRGEARQGPMPRAENGTSLPSGCPPEASMGSNGTKEAQDHAGGRGMAGGVSGGKAKENVSGNFLKPLSPVGKKCKAWLESYLTDERAVSETIAEAKRNGYGLSILYESRKHLPIIVRHGPSTGARPPAFWRL